MEAAKAKSGRKAKNETKTPDSRKRPLFEAGERRIDELRRVAAAAMNDKPPTRAPVPETKKSRVPGIKVVSHSDEIAGSDADPDADFDTELHSSVANGDSKKPERPTPAMQLQKPIKKSLSGRKRSHESSPEAVPSPKDDQDSEYRASDSEQNDSDDDDREDVKIKSQASFRPKRAAAGANFKEKRIRIDEKDGRIDVKEGRTADDEDVAIVLTAQPGEDQTPQRRILDFIIHDEDGIQRSGEHIDFCNLFISSLVLPMKGVLDKEKAVRCNGFGPIVSWSIMGYEKTFPTLVFCTDLAEYYCSKPAGHYKKLYNVLFDKAKVCVDVYRSLSKPEGGDPLLNLDELIARVSRSFSKQGSSGQFFNREFIINNGKFVVAQLYALDTTATDKQQLFSGLPALVSLEKEGSKRSSNFANPAPPVKAGTLTIREGSSRVNGDCSGGADSMSGDFSPLHFV